MKESKWIESLMTNRQSRKQYEQLIYDLKRGRYREFESSDSYKVGLNAIVIVTKGKGRREVFQRIEHHLADSGSINKWGDIYLYDKDDLFQNVNGYPQRFKPTSHRILIDTNVVDVTND